MTRTAQSVLRQALIVSPIPDHTAEIGTIQLSWIRVYVRSPLAGSNSKPSSTEYVDVDVVAVPVFAFGGAYFVPCCFWMVTYTQSKIVGVTPWNRFISVIPHIPSQE